jgi:LmbE family N-acetylglucosaminyl deacetylase
MGNCFADVTDTSETKLAAITGHASQLPKLDVESSRDLARAMGRISGFAYAEAFDVLRIRI